MNADSREWWPSWVAFAKWGDRACILYDLAAADELNCDVCDSMPASSRGASGYAIILGVSSRDGCANVRCPYVPRPSYWNEELRLYYFDTEAEALERFHELELELVER